MLLFDESISLRTEEYCSDIDRLREKVDPKERSLEEFNYGTLS
jgi:hypothetical protein